MVCCSSSLLPLSKESFSISNVDSLELSAATNCCGESAKWKLNKFHKNEGNYFIKRYFCSLIMLNIYLHQFQDLCPRQRPMQLKWVLQQKWFYSSCSDNPDTKWRLDKEIKNVTFFIALLFVNKWTNRLTKSIVGYKQNHV